MMCRRFDTLPHEGGIMDQDHLLIRKLVMVLDAFDEAAKNKSPKEK